MEIHETAKGNSSDNRPPMPDNKTRYYYGGLAELVPVPSPLTYSFLAYWFTGVTSLGRAMKLLGLPCAHQDIPILELVSGEAVVSLESEEKTLYGPTIFKYSEAPSWHDHPQTQIDFRKVIDFSCIVNTLRVLKVQTLWISSPKKMLQTAEDLFATFPPLPDSEEIVQIDTILVSEVWPRVIAIGYLSEFCAQLFKHNKVKNISDVNRYISQQVAEKDWFFASINDQLKVKNGEMTFTEYLELYGFRGDSDYELTCPRWYEIPKTIKKRIQEYVPPPEKKGTPDHITDPLVNTSIDLLVLRSAAKRKTLPFIDALRQGIKSISGETQKMALLTRTELMQNKDFKKALPTTGQTHARTQTAIFHGKGIAVSTGIAEGPVKKVQYNSDMFPSGSVCLFPHASPEFANLYPKCAGMIFLRGGRTSHGVIVAREFGIPALIDPQAVSIPNGSHIHLDGEKGTWKIDK